jgi:hydrophobe/amphiphile efflux-3 (HAE3) family protein
MHDLRDTYLGRLGVLEYKYSKIIVIAMLVLTLFFGSQSLNLSFESDLMKEIPQEFDVVKTQQLITNEFGAEEAIIILLQTNLDEVSDIRNKDSLESIYRLEQRLKSRPEILDAFGPGTVYYSIFGEIPDNETYLKDVAETMPQLISSDYSAAIVLVRTTSFVYDQASINSIVKIVEEEIEKENLYGLNYNVTGSPILIKTLLEILQEDIVRTVVFALLIILILLTLIFHSKSLLVIAPPVLGMIWTTGQLSLMGVPISMATGTFGAIIIGLGTEYGIFMMSRYREEAKKGASNETRVVAMIAGVGKGTIGSSTTTIAGFAALTFSSMPEVVHLGQTLSLGIINCLIGAFFFLPCLMSLKEWNVSGIEIKNKRLEKNITKFSELQAKRPKSFLLVGIVITLLLASGMSYIKVVEETEESSLPENSQVMQVFNTLKDKFQRYDSMLVLIESENVLSPNVLKEVYLLNKQLINIYGIEGSSFNLDIKDIYLPKEDLKRRIEVSDSLEYLILRLDISKGADQLQVYDDVKNELTMTPLSVQPGGTISMIRELTDIIMPEMSKLSTLGLIGILACVMLTFMSIRYGIIPLIAVGVGIMWMMGIAGFMGTTMDSGLVGILSIMAGIGIDFAIQTINRFRLERSPVMVEKIVNTVQGIFEPVILSSVVAGFGFMAILAATLNFLDVLGKLLFVGVFSCAGITLLFLPSFLVVQERFFKDTKKLFNKKKKLIEEI